MFRRDRRAITACLAVVGEHKRMLTPGHLGSTTSSPDEWLVRRVASEREGLEQLRAGLLAMESEPTTWFAPSRDAYVQRLRALGDELQRAIAATEDLALQLNHALAAVL